MLGRVFNYGLNGYHGLDWIKPFNPIQIFLSRKKLKKRQQDKNLKSSCIRQDLIRA